jgi:hypothetical protein
MPQTEPRDPRASPLGPLALLVAGVVGITGLVVRSRVSAGSFANISVSQWFEVFCATVLCLLFFILSIARRLGLSRQSGRRVFAFTVAFFMVCVLFYVVVRVVGLVLNLQKGP